jgi:hypothetical protein
MQHPDETSGLPGVILMIGLKQVKNKNFMEMHVFASSFRCAGRQKTPYIKN